MRKAINESAGGMGSAGGRSRPGKRTAPFVRSNGWRVTRSAIQAEDTHCAWAALVHPSANTDGAVVDAGAGSTQQFMAMTGAQSRCAPSQSGRADAAMPAVADVAVRPRSRTPVTSHRAKEDRTAGVWSKAGASGPMRNRCVPARLVAVKAANSRADGACLAPAAGFSPCAYS